ncbi:hypothetical protein WJX81_001936 [Elliptochloris bilobata]|uniref:SET domain-containing protein n=1 Tax=Elliptochloris bilobata TaxID=381761 RepID=A0AAW1RME6_9CHLO
MAARQVALLCALTAASWLLYAAASVDPESTALLSLFRAHGGEADVHVAEVRPGLRGVVAARDVAAGEAIISLPPTLAIQLTSTATPAPDSAAMLVRRWRTDANLTAYWQFLPKQLLTRNTFPEAALDLLQSKAMKAYALTHQVQAEEIHRREDLAAEGISEAEFRHANDLVSAYSFGFQVSPDERLRILMPVLDATNYGDVDDEANVEVRLTTDGGFVAVSTRPISSGDEVLYSYTPACRRNDYSLFHYGFLQEKHPPRLCALDTPGGTLYDAPGLEEERDYGEGGILATREELQRLEALLAAFPTSEDQDARLLLGQRGWLAAWTGAKPLSGVEQLFVRFRMLRKRALRYWIDRLQEVLDLADAQEL